MKTHFQAVLFTDESSATLDGPDGWNSGWLVDGHCVITRLRSQQGGGGVMFWSGIMGSDLVSPFRVPEGVKMTSAKHVKFLTAHFLPRYKKNCAWATIIPWPQPYWELVEHPSMEALWGWAAVCLKTAAPGGNSGILMRELSKWYQRHAPMLIVTWSVTMFWLK